PDQPDQQQHDHDAEGVDAQAKRECDEDQDQRLKNDREHVAQRAAEQKRNAAHRRHPKPLDDPHAQLGDQAEPHARSAEHAQLHQQPRNEDVVRPTGRKSAHRRDRFEERREQDQVEQRLENAECDPDGVVDEDPEVASEDEPCIAQDLHAAVSRSERPVWRRKTSSRLGRCNSTVVSWRFALSSNRRIAGIATSPRSTYRWTEPFSSRASRTKAWSLTRSSARCGSPAMVKVTTSPAIARLSSSGVPSATILP